MLNTTKNVVNTSLNAVNTGVNAISSGLEAINVGFFEQIAQKAREIDLESKVKHKATIAYLKSEEFKKSVNNEVMMNHIIKQSEELEELEQKLDGETREYVVKSIKALIDAKKNMINFMLKELK